MSPLGVHMTSVNAQDIKEMYKESSPSPKAQHHQRDDYSSEESIKSYEQ